MTSDEPNASPAEGSAAAPPPAVPRPRRSTLFLSLLVLALAFVTASFPARNSDLWFHLAAGRLLAQRQLPFGADPFSYTSEGYWVNHAWLFDLGAYGLYGLDEGACLVAVKALCFTALVALLLRVRRCPAAVWLPPVCTALVVLCASPRLLVQPALASYCLFGLTFWLLWRRHAAAPGEAPPPGWPLFVVFVLWVNVDEWFLLGPVLVALFCLGERVGGRAPTPYWLVPATLAVCLLNPHGWRAFALPAELSPITWSSGLREDIRFRAAFDSPWQSAYVRAALALDPAALAYFGLTALAAASFLFHREALRSWRAVVWLTFGALAAWQARTIPFYAVVAGPIAALNWQDWAAARRPSTPGWAVRLAARLRPAIVAVALLGLIASAVFGWPEGSKRGRSLGWSVQADPSLRRAAEEIGTWRWEGLLPEGVRVFALSPEAAHHCAWFAPGERQFFDHRYSLSSRAAREYEEVCAALEPGLARHGEDAGDWRRVLRGYAVGVVLLHDRDPQRFFAVQGHLAADTQEWTLLRVAGQALLVGWNDGLPPANSSPLAFDEDRLAFGPSDRSSLRQLPVAPNEGPQQLPERRDGWPRLDRSSPRVSWESAAAGTFLHYFHVSEPDQRRRQLRVSLAAFAGSLAGLPSQPCTGPLAAFQVVSSRRLLLPHSAGPSFLVRDQLGPYFRHLVDRPPALPLLAVRAARTSVAADPADANAWLRLGQAYLLLRGATCERSAEGMLPPLAQLRQVQAVTALEQAVRLDPRLEAAHHELGYLYGEANAIDQALTHRQAEAKGSRLVGPRRGETKVEWEHRLELLERDVSKIEEMVRERSEALASGSSALQGDRVRQARAALGLGLARQAADDVLLTTPAALLGAEGIKLELEVLLSLGRADTVRTILRDDAATANRHALGYYDLRPPARPDAAGLSSVPYHLPAYEWMDVLQSAALGDYGQARDSLRVMRLGLASARGRLRQQLDGLARGEMELLPPLLSGPPVFLPAFAAWGLHRLEEQATSLELGEQVLRAQEADLAVLEGLLALEQGTTLDAQAAFAEALRVAVTARGESVPFAGKPIASYYRRGWYGRGQRGR